VCDSLYVAARQGNSAHGWTQETW